MEIKILLAVVVLVHSDCMCGLSLAAPASDGSVQELNRIGNNELAEEFSFPSYGINFFQFAGRFGETANALREIAKFTNAELNKILVNAAQEIRTEIHYALEDAIAKAQVILSPVLKRMNSILTLVSGADSINALSVMADIILDLSQRLGVDMQTANKGLQKLAQQIIGNILIITRRVGSEIAKALIAVLKKLMIQLKEVLGPLEQEMSITFDLGHKETSISLVDSINLIR